jgi:hypothetical protein
MSPSHIGLEFLPPATVVAVAREQPNPLKISSHLADSFAIPAFILLFTIAYP